jgi:hypothetical protein
MRAHHIGYHGAMSRRTSAGVWVAVLVAAIVTRPARAETEAQLSVSASSSLTDNVFGVSDVSTTEPEADLYFGVSPSLRVWRQTPRLILTGTLGASASRYLDATSANSVELRAGTQLDYDMAPTLRSSVSLSGSYVDAGALEPEGVVGAVPEGRAHYLSGQLALGVQKNLSQRWRLADNLRLGIVEPVGDDSQLRPGITAANGVAVQLSEARDAYEVRLDGGVNHYSERFDGQPGGQTDYTAALTGSWLRELSPLWSLAFTGGVSLALIDDDAAVAPLARAAISRRGRQVSFDAEVAQSVSANLLLGQTLATSDASVGVTALLGTRWSVRGSVGGSHARSFTGDDTPPINSLRTSARAELRLLDNLGLSLAHDLLYQVTSAADEGGEAATLRRNRVTLSVTGYWPPERPQRASPSGVRLRVRQSEEREEAEER